MYAVLFLVLQISNCAWTQWHYGTTFLEVITQEPRKDNIMDLEEDITQEPRKDNIMDLEEDINIFTNNIATFTKDWMSLDEAIDGIKNQIISKDKIDFTIIWENWPESRMHNQYQECNSYIYEQTERSKIENQFKNPQTIVTKLMHTKDMHKNYIAETLRSLNNQVTILKELLIFKNCDQSINCAKEQTWALDKIKRNKIVLEHLKDKAKNTLEVLTTVSYNIYKQKYAIRTELLRIKNKYTCCILGKIKCMDVSNEMYRFEPLNFDSLLPKLKSNSQLHLIPFDQELTN